jgi:N6-adenosine-specific RNA methylase IME4
MPDLCAMPVASVADNQAHLYLWTTNAFMREAHDLAEAWGFKVKTCLTWGKVKDDGTASMKTGYYFRGATEHCLFAVRGRLPLQVKHGKPTLYLSRRLPHSVKPEWFYALCEECSPGPRLELFARRARPGWTVWGNEVPCKANPTADRRATAQEGTHE